MKRLSYESSAFIFLMLLCLATAWAQQATGPRMVLKENYFDAQEVKEGDIIEHTFTVLNKGDRDLEIKRINPG